MASGFSRKNHAFSTSFTFTVARPPEYIVTITAVDSTVHEPAGRVEIRLGPYRATTDEQGRAAIPIPSGSYDAIAWKAGYEAEPVTVNVTADVALRIDLRPIAGTEEPVLAVGSRQSAGLPAEAVSHNQLVALPTAAPVHCLLPTAAIEC